MKSFTFHFVVIAIDLLSLIYEMQNDKITLNITIKMVKQVGR